MTLSPLHPKQSGSGLRVCGDTHWDVQLACAAGQLHEWRARDAPSTAFCQVFDQSERVRFQCDIQARQNSAGTGTCSGRRSPDVV